MDVIVIEIDREIQNLEKELLSNPHFVRWRALADLKKKHIQHLKEVRALLGSQQAQDENPANPAEVRADDDTQETNEVTMQIKTSPTELIIEHARKVIRDHGAPMPFGKLYDAIVKCGFVIGGNDPRCNLSAKLSNAKDRIYNAKPYGWWLPERKQELESRANGVTRLS